MNIEPNYIFTPNHGNQDVEFIAREHGFADAHSEALALLAAHFPQASNKTLERYAKKVLHYAEGRIGCSVGIVIANCRL